MKSTQSIPRPTPVRTMLCLSISSSKSSVMDLKRVFNIAGSFVAGCLVGFVWMNSNRIFRNAGFLLAGCLVAVVLFCPADCFIMDSKDLFMSAGFAISAYLTWLVVYRLVLSPIAKYPGPKLAALSNWYEFYYDVLRQGNFTAQIQTLHDLYGTYILRGLQRYPT